MAFLNKGKIVELGKPAELKLKYAKDIVKVSFKNGKEVEVSKDAKQLMQSFKKKIHRLVLEPFILKKPTWLKYF